jgi:ubiquinone/menaquinone biosynthesis C-methylase UbiE
MKEKENFVYGVGSKYYDKIYSFIDYKKEVDLLKLFIKKYKLNQGNSLLDVACGTGNHIPFFKKEYDVTGIDKSAEMIKIAKSKIEDVDFIISDMLTLNLNKKFDVILCLASSISYLENYTNLKKVIKRLSGHLNSGGVLIIEPWQTKNGDDISGKPYLLTYDSEDLKIARVGTMKKRGIISILETSYLIAERNKKIQYFNETHRLATYDDKKFLNIMNNQGLKSHIEKLDNNFYIGVKN